MGVVRVFLVNNLWNWVSTLCVETIIAIETSMPDASVVLWRDGEMVFGQEFKSDRHHNCMVFDSVAKALDLLDGGELSVVLVGTGPGSYSGIRIGIAVAQGVAIAYGCPSAGLGSLAATPEARGGSGAMGVGDARRGLYFVSPIHENGEAMEVELMDARAFSDRLREESGRILFSLDDPGKLGLDAELEQRVTRTRPRAELLVEVWRGLSEARQRELSQAPLSPTYLRAPFTSKAKEGHPLLRGK